MIVLGSSHADLPTCVITSIPTSTYCTGDGNFFSHFYHVQNIVTHKHSFITVSLISILFFFFSFKLTICTVSSILLQRETCIDRRTSQWYVRLVRFRQETVYCSLHSCRSTCFIRGEERGIDGLHAGGTREGAHQPVINTVLVVHMHAGKESQHVSQCELHHADDTSGNKKQQAFRPKVYCRMYWTKSGSYWFTMVAKSLCQVAGILCPLLTRNLAIHQTKSAMLTVQPKLALLILHVI